MPGNNDVQLNRSAAKSPIKKPRRGLPVKPMRMVIMAFFAAVTVLVVSMLILMVVGGSKSEAELIKKDKYQAVFLSDTSGQVYFGKLKSLNARYFQLTDIFYVKVENAVQPDKKDTASQNISLAKLGNELHGPEDTMYISRDKVLFWENLKEDGQVVKAITEFKKSGSPTTSQPQTQATTQNQSTTTQTTTNKAD